MARKPWCFYFEIKKHVQKYMNGQTTESFSDRIVSMSVFNDIEWTKKGNTDTCVHSAKGVAAFATQFKPGHSVSWGPRQRTRGETENPNTPPPSHNPNNPQGQLDSIALQMVDIHIQVSHFTFNIQGVPSK